MYLDIHSLQTFYRSPLGKKVQQNLSAALQPHIPMRNDERIMGLGYCVPYLEPFRLKCDACFAFMPARQGASTWPDSQNVATALVFEEDLPLADSCLDKIILVHALEQTENAIETLREIWRVLAPNGKLIIIVANRRGLWAGSDATPFGSGEPYSRGQLHQIVTNAGFTCQSLSETLHFLPQKNLNIRRFSKLFEKMQKRFFPYFGGVLILEATKHINQGIPLLKRNSRRIFLPVFNPQTTLTRDEQHLKQ